MQALLPSSPITVPVSGSLVDLFVSHLVASYPWLYHLATIGKLRLSVIESSETTDNMQINRQGMQFH